MASSKRDVGVGTLASKLKDEIVQTEKWIQNVSNKLIQTLAFVRPTTVESSIQTDRDAASANDQRPAVVQQVSQIIQVNMDPPMYVVNRDHIETQTDYEISSPNMDALPVIIKSDVHSQTDAPVVQPKHSIQVQTCDLQPQPHQQHHHQKTQQVQTDDVVPVKRLEVQVQTVDSVSMERTYICTSSRKSIAVGEGAVNDVLCDQCRSKRSRSVACSTQVVRQMAGVNVATQCFAPCMVSRLDLLVASTQCHCRR